MAFNLNLITLPKLIRIDGKQRLYETPAGEKYPSVTTILSATSDKSHLLSWKKRIGEEQANKITRQAASRGTGAHALWEKHVLNEPYNLSQQVPLTVHLFKQLKNVLDTSVDNIRCSESSLYSHKLKVAGSVDLIAEYNGVPSIIDFKTSLRNKRREWITDYFLQAAIYSMMFYEMAGIKHKQLVIMIAIEEESVPQVFVDDISNWYVPAIERVKNFYNMHTTA